MQVSCFFVTPEVYHNSSSLEKARAYLNQVPWGPTDGLLKWWLYHLHFHVSNCLS